MKRFLFTLVALTFTTLSINGVQASAPKGSSKATSKATPKVAVQQNAKVHATHHASNVRFQLRSYRGWNAYCWFPRFGCYGFYDPCCQGWFYWSQTGGQFLPVDSLATNAPTTSGATLLPTGAAPVSTANPVTPALPVEPAPTIPVSTANPVTPALPVEPAPLIVTPPLIETPAPVVMSPAVNP
jgi:hypothetical protein